MDTFARLCAMPDFASEVWRCKCLWLSIKRFLPISIAKLFNCDSAAADQPTKFTFSSSVFELRLMQTPTCVPSSLDGWLNTSLIALSFRNYIASISCSPSEDRSGFATCPTGLRSVKALASPRQSTYMTFYWLYHHSTLVHQKVVLLSVEKELHRRLCCVRGWKIP